MTNIPETLRQASEALQQASAALTTVAQAIEDAPGPEPEPGEWRNDRAPGGCISDTDANGKVWAWDNDHRLTAKIYWRSVCKLMRVHKLQCFWAPGNRPAPKSPPPDVVGSQRVEPEKPRGFFPFTPEEFATACSEPQPEAPPKPGEPRAVVEHQGTGYSRLERFMLHGMPDDTGPQWIIGRVPTEDDADSDGFVVVSVRYAALYAPAKCSVRWACVHLGTPWAPVNAIPGTPFDPTCLDRNGWIRSRLPTVEDTGSAGGVLIPVGHGGTNASINYHLIVPGQPWAPWGSNPGGFEK